MDAVLIYASDPVSCFVCAPADMPLEEVAAALNLQNPTGLSHGWKLSADETFADGTTPMPTVCYANPDRRHYLFTC